MIRFANLSFNNFNSMIIDEQPQKADYSCVALSMTIFYSTIATRLPCKITPHVIIKLNQSVGRCMLKMEINAAKIPQPVHPAIQTSLISANIFPIEATYKVSTLTKWSHKWCITPLGTACPAYCVSYTHKRWPPQLVSPGATPSLLASPATT